MVPELPDNTKSSLDISNKRMFGIACMAIFSFFVFMTVMNYVMTENPNNSYILAMAWSLLWICFAVFMVVLICWLGGIHPSRILQYFRYVQSGKID